MKKEKRMQRMKLQFWIFILVLSFVPGLNAQDCEVYFPVEEGSVREMTSYDKKDRVTGKTIQTVKEVNRSGDAIGIRVEAQSYDDKDELLATQELEMVCENGIFKFDMRNYLDQSAMAGMEGFDITMDVTELEVPSDLQVGDELEEGEISIEASTGGATMFRMNVRIYERKVEAKEEITTSAGTFECYKMTYAIETKALVRMEQRVVDWMAPGVGVVRSEYYNKSGKLTGYSVLTGYR